MNPLIAATIAVGVAYVGWYMMTYEANGLARIPFGAVEEATKIEISAPPESESIPWDLPTASTGRAGAPDLGEEALSKRLFAPLRFIDFKIRSIAHDIGISDYGLVRMDDGMLVVFWDE